MALEDLSIQDLVRKRRGLRRRLSEQPELVPLRIAVLGGFTTNELVELLEVHLLEVGFAPLFYQSDYGRYYETAVHQVAALQEFRPDLVYLCTSHRNVVSTPEVSWTEEDLRVAVEAEVLRFSEIWSSIEKHLGCQVLQNNFDLPPLTKLGNLDAVTPGGATRFYLELNASFSREARRTRQLTIIDILSASAQLGLQHWYDPDRWFSYKLLWTVEATVLLARSLTSVIQAMYGRSRKVLVLDLDNTLWGGVIGDDGLERIQIGRETPMAEAFTAFQEYCLALRRQGILLAVCSKNDEAMARSGFLHPDSVLKLEDISCFRANWQPKDQNILSIAKELNLGTDSFVFADDNPAERAIVKAQMPEVAVPELGSNPSRFAEVIQAGRYFEPASLSSDDLARASQYTANMQRAESSKAFTDYGEYLDSLQMKAEIAPFRKVLLDRITQLTNKTNQFNLTTRRYTLAEMEAVLDNRDYIGLYGRLQDRYGDNGLVSVILGRREHEDLWLDLWLMSCRVLKRDLEFAMLDALVARARLSSITSLRGVYVPTTKNGMVANLYDLLGFQREETSPEGTVTYMLAVKHYVAQNKHIQVRGTEAEA